MKIINAIIGYFKRTEYEDIHTVIKRLNAKNHLKFRSDTVVKSADNQIDKEKRRVYK